MTCGAFGEVGEVEEGFGVGDVTGAGAGPDAGEADVASITYSRGSDAGMRAR